MSKTSIDITCPICHSNRTKEWATVNDYAMHRCLQCLHVFVSTPVSENQLAEAYGQAYYQGSPDVGSSALTGYEDYLRNADRRLRGFNDCLVQLERFARPPGRYLDYGCAIGLSVRAALDRGWDAVGYDHSEWAAAFGREKFQLDLRTGALPGFDDNSFDLITLWDCIEHLPQPWATLASLRLWLKPGGILAISTVNSSSLGARLAGVHWRHIAPPMHLHLFSRQSLHALAASVGLSRLDSQCEGVVAATSHGSDRAGRVTAWVDDALCHWRMKRIAYALNLRDETYLVVRKEP